MNQDFFKKLPPEITINILSRLPIRTVAGCKCVHKSWLNLLATHEFVKSHLSKSLPGLLVLEHEEQSKFHRILEFEDGLDLERNELHYNHLTKFNLPYSGKIHGSVNGLLFLRDEILKPDGLFICNPITHDYIKLQCPQEFVQSDIHFVTYGFGASKITGLLKVVRISQEYFRETNEMVKISRPDWQVYTLGTGAWRRIAPTPSFLFGDPTFKPGYHTTGAYLNGVLHWLVFDLNGFLRVSCFDIETETFFNFSTPLPLPGSQKYLAALCPLGESLCLCDTKSNDEIVIWLVKDYGDKKVWEKKFVIGKTNDFFPFRFMYGLIIPLKVFKDGDILMKWDGSFLFYHSTKNNTNAFDLLVSWHEGIVHTPSFLSLKSFKMENASSF